MTATRDCALCGRAFPVPANNPHRRYCTPRCRVADWRHRHQPAPGSDHDNPPAAAVPNAVPNAVPTPDAANADPRCPHCGQAVAVVTLLVPAAAAHVRTPQVPHV